MGAMDGSRQRLDQGDGLAQGQRFAVLGFGQRRPLDVLDSVVEQLALAFAGVEDLHDVGMAEPAQRRSLAA